MPWGYCCTNCRIDLDGYDTRGDHDCYEYTKHNLHPDLYCFDCGEQVWTTAIQAHAVHQRLTAAGIANDVIRDVIKIIDPHNYSTKYIDEINFDTDRARYGELLDLRAADSSQITEEHCKEHNDLIAKHGKRICYSLDTWDYADLLAIRSDPDI